MISFFVLLWAAVVAGRPNVVPLNVVTVPPNCPEGQQWINGQCRDIWKIYAEPQSDLDNSNVISVPPNCPAGQEWINGACRDVWRYLYDNVESLATGNEESVPNKIEGSTPTRNVITVPTNCPPGQQLVNGVCRDIWKLNEFNIVSPPLLIENEESSPARNVITVPTNCQTDQQLVNGVCRDIWKLNELNFVPLPNENEGTVPTEYEEYLPAKNVITVPTNCPSGQEWINGACRDVWRSLLRDNIAIAQVADIENPKNIINVPNQCPIGYRPQWDTDYI